MSTSKGFDISKFQKQVYTPRTKEVPVPALKDFFPEDADLVWKVRGLTADEIAKSKDAADRNQVMGSMVSAMATKTAEGTVDAVKQLLGVSSDVNADIARRLEHLTTASIEPEIPLELAVKLAEVFPVEFYNITTEILTLTGQGQVPGKPKPSGKKKASE